jgi:hypothetical protein
MASVARGARAVGVDLLFLGPDVNPPVPGTKISNDELVAAVIDRDPRFVNGYYFPLEQADGRDLTPRDTVTIEPGQEAWVRFTMPLPDGVALLRTTDVPSTCRRTSPRRASTSAMSGSSRTSTARSARCRS